MRVTLNFNFNFNSNFHFNFNFNFNFNFTFTFLESSNFFTILPFYFLCFLLFTGYLLPFYFLTFYSFTFFTFLLFTFYFYFYLVINPTIPNNTSNLHRQTVWNMACPPRMSTNYYHLELLIKLIHSSFLPFGPHIHFF